MGGNNSNRNRFPLPDNWTVDEFICAVVPVPNDPQYIAILRGLLDTLTWSRSFTLHPTEQAARQVADTWAAALASQELTFQGCEMQIFRAKPGRECIIEGSLDGGETWSTVYNPTACGMVIIPADFSDDDDAEAAAAAVMRGVFQPTIQTILDGIDDSLTDDEIMQRLIDEVWRALPNPPLPALRSIISQVRDMPTPTAEDYLEDCLYTDFWDWLKGIMESSGVDWVDDFANGIVDFMDGITDQLVRTLVEGLAFTWGDQWGPYFKTLFQTNGVDDFGEGCGSWTHTFDFSIDEQGWEAGGDGTYYNTANGWNTSGGAINIHTGTFPSIVQITRCVATVFYYPGSANPGMSCTKYPEGDVLGQLIEFNTVYDMTCDETIDVSAVMVSYDPYVGGGGGTGQLLIGVTLYGTGPDPF